jgi:hypothetical protein
MDKGADEAKNSIDNPENAGDNDGDDGNREKFHVKKDVQSQLDASNTQLVFKVMKGFKNVIFMFAQFLFSQNHQLISL